MVIAWYATLRQSHGDARGDVIPVADFLSKFRWQQMACVDLHNQLSFFGTCPTHLLQIEEP